MCLVPLNIIIASQLHNKIYHQIFDLETKRCLENLVSKSDMNNAHDKINRKRGIGKSLKEEYNNPEG